MYRENFLQEITDQQLMAEYKSLKEIRYADMIICDEMDEIKIKIQLVLAESVRRKIDLFL